MACARSPSRGFAAHLVLHSPFPAAARPQGRILSIALQQVGDDKHTAGGGGRLVDVDQVTPRCFSRRSASPPRRRDSISAKTAPKMDRIPDSCSPREHHVWGRHHRKYSHPAHPSKEPLSPIVCGGTLAAARCRSLTRSHSAHARDALPMEARRDVYCPLPKRAHHC